MSTVKELILAARQQLSSHQIEDASFNVDCLAAMALNTTNSRMPLYWAQPATPEFTETFSLLIKRRCENEPLQYILGEWSFIDFDITVASGALIPRPETEEVFMAAVRAIEKTEFHDSFKFADVGTGTGVLGIALARKFVGASGFLVDISADALAIAAGNLLRFPELANRVETVNADLLSSFGSDQLNVVLSNPPYINSADIAGLMPEVSRFEPHLALDGGVTGVELIAKLIMQAEKVLVAGGIFVFEHGHGQRKTIRSLLNENWILLEAGDDLAGCERYFVVKRAAKLLHSNK